MTDTPKDGGPAFAAAAGTAVDMDIQHGMSLRQYYVGQALANPNVCTGKAPEYQLRAWFGDRVGITSVEILAMQALDAADAILKVGSK